MLVVIQGLAFRLASFFESLIFGQGSMNNPKERKQRCFGCSSEIHGSKDCPRGNNLLIKFRYAGDWSIQEIYIEFAKYGEIKCVTIKKCGDREIFKEAFLSFETAGEAAKVLQAQENKSR